MTWVCDDKVGRWVSGLLRRSWLRTWVGRQQRGREVRVYGVGRHQLELGLATTTPGAGAGDGDGFGFGVEWR